MAVTVVTAMLLVGILGIIGGPVGVVGLMGIGGPAGSNQWFKEGLSFGCTGCGRCCKMDGDVWLSPEEQPVIAAAIGETVETFREKYTRQTLKEWACLKQNSATTTDGIAGSGTGCVFLSSEGQCTIYETRPVQCRTYPFWPSLLEDIEDWEEEAVVPDDDASSSDLKRRWSLEDGGCEGINHKDAPVIAADEIELKRREARAHWRRFPGRKIKHDTWYL
jgi:Fe-S-cluster containining protein